MILILTQVSRYDNNSILLLLLALVFGSLGDLVLEYCGEKLFGLGAGLFLLGHICYNGMIL